MDAQIDFSVIIPHRDSIQYLPKLLGSIPVSKQIEIILVDNSPTPIQQDQIPTDREFTLLYSSPSRGAGGARNEGIDHAHGKWLLFADADDFFTDDAFETFYRHIDSQAEMIYFSMDSIFQNNGQHSVRGEQFTKLVQDYLNGQINEYELRLGYSSPCAKMVSHSMVKEHAIRYDEVIAGNDKYFSMLCGYYAQKIEADDVFVYVATATSGSLTQRSEFKVLYSRLHVNLRYNQFLRQHNLSKYQSSIMNWLILSLKVRPSSFPKLIWLLLKFRQSPFIGFSRWGNTIKNYRKRKESA